MSLDIRIAYLEIRKARIHKFAPEFMEYLFHLVFRSSFKGKEFQHLTGENIRTLFKEQITVDFGALANLVLKKWGVVNFGDLGEAIFLLAKNGCFKLHELDNQDEYLAAGPIHVP